MNRTILKNIYFLIAGLWTLMCLYGIYDTAIKPSNPEAYDLTPTQMGFGFALTALLAWIPWLILYLRRKNPKTATLEQTFDRVGREFYKETHDKPKPRSQRPDEEDDDDEARDSDRRHPH
ncbi:hypothetical protein KRX19_00395 [Cardiobacteriaceae bacterium TAE3-ERU3]|nr:hypothetical protein [Cardiobacteriaceae bacterium TAE3-ERU3]